MKHKIKKVDWLIYRLFKWRWDRIFLENPAMFNAFIMLASEKATDIDKNVK